MRNVKGIYVGVTLDSPDGDINGAIASYKNIYDCLILFCIYSRVLRKHEVLFMSGEQGSHGEANSERVAESHLRVSLRV